MNLISLGAGVQSTVMLLMAARGGLEPFPDGAIFADTGWEPRGVYYHLDWLEAEVKRLTNGRLPIYRVNNGNIREKILQEGYSDVPFFQLAKDGVKMGRRQCTHQFKLRPLAWKARELLGRGRKERVEPGAVSMWIGISTDEAARMKPSGVKWRVNRWPLIEAGMSRNDCHKWFERHYPGHPLAKSACIGCPFHNDAEWRDMRDNDPVSWGDAVEVDGRIRFLGTKAIPQFMHPSCVPLDQVDLTTLEDHGQLNMFNNECEGMCGV